MYRVLFCGDVFINQEEVNLDFNIEADLLVFNLEYSMSKEGQLAPGKINLYADSFNLDIFMQKYNRLAVCLANNHIMDYGEIGFRNTLTLLEQHGIKYFGAGYIQDNENNPCIIQLGGGKNLGFLGYCCPTTHPIFSNQNKPGAAKLEKEKFLRDLAQLKQQVDYSIVSLHWGMEEIYLPRPEDVQLAHELADAGADIIIGHHAHAPQPVEKYKDTIIAYGLGNFIFPDLNTPAYCDENGIPSTFWQKKESYWNRFSLGLVVDLNNNAYEIRKFWFNDWQVKEVTKGFERIINYDVNQSDYEKWFRKHLKQRRMAIAFRHFLLNPKLPRIKHFKRIWNAFGGYL